MKKQTIVYRHKRKDNNEVFYVGVGTLRRSKDKSHRSKWWKSVSNKYGYDIEILTPFISWEDAIELEMLLISEYGRLDQKTGCLVNMTNGGDGCIGRKMSEENKKKLSEANKGHKRRLGCKHSQETIDKIRKSALGIIPSLEARAKMADAKRGLKLKEEHKIKLKNANLGNTYMKGRKHSDQAKIKMSCVVLLNPETGIFYSLGEATTVFDMKYVTLNKQTSGKLPNKTPLIRV